MAALCTQLFQQIPTPHGVRQTIVLPLSGAAVSAQKDQTESSASQDSLNAACGLKRGMCGSLPVAKRPVISETIETDSQLDHAGGKPVEQDVHIGGESEEGLCGSASQEGYQTSDSDSDDDVVEYVSKSGLANAIDAKWAFQEGEALSAEMVKNLTRVYALPNDDVLVPVCHTLECGNYQGSYDFDVEVDEQVDEQGMGHALDFVMTCRERYLHKHGQGGEKTARAWREMRAVDESSHNPETDDEDDEEESLDGGSDKPTLDDADDREDAICFQELPNQFSQRHRSPTVSDDTDSDSDEDMLEYASKTGLANAIDAKWAFQEGEALSVEMVENLTRVYALPDDEVLVPVCRAFGCLESTGPSDSGIEVGGQAAEHALSSVMKRRERYLHKHGEGSEITVREWHEMWAVDESSRNAETGIQDGEGESLDERSDKPENGDEEDQEENISSQELPNQLHQSIQNYNSDSDADEDMIEYVSSSALGNFRWMLQAGEALSIDMVKNLMRVYALPDDEVLLPVCLASECLDSQGSYDFDVEVDEQGMGYALISLQKRRERYVQKHGQAGEITVKAWRQLKAVDECIDDAEHHDGEYDEEDLSEDASELPSSAE